MIEESSYHKFCLSWCNFERKTFELKYEDNKTIFIPNKDNFKNENLCAISELMEKNVVILSNPTLIVNYIMSKTNIVNEKDLWLCMMMNDIK